MTIRKNVPCKECGNDTYDATYADGLNDSGELVRVWVCYNCNNETPRHTRTRKSNLAKSLEIYDALKTEFAPIDTAIEKAIEAGLVRYGFKLVHGSLDNYGLGLLQDGFTAGKISSRNLSYAATHARKAIARAAAELAEVGITV